MPVTYFTNDGTDTRGVLLERFAGELAPGWTVQLWPQERPAALLEELCGINDLGVRLVGEGPEGDARNDFGGHLVTCVIPLAFSQVTATNIVDVWMRPTILVFPYKTVLAPGVWLELMIQVAIDTNPREQVFKPLGLAPEVSLTVAPWIEVNWWARFRDVDVSASLEDALRMEKK